jgi:uncharacterized protein YkwD
MDPFAVIMLGGAAGLLIALLLLGRFYPGSGADQLDWRPTRSAEEELQSDADDLEQMLEATNARRRRRGRPELTEDSVRASVRRDLAESTKRRDDHLAELEVVQMNARKNERRRRKGLPELTVEEERARILRERGVDA